jgi:hypothetical protein
MLRIFRKLGARVLEARGVSLPTKLMAAGVATAPLWIPYMAIDVVKRQERHAELERRREAALADKRRRDERDAREKLRPVLDPPARVDRPRVEPADYYPEDHVDTDVWEDRV